ncbi:MAG TPA: AraC family transcriptional regulator, partial [Polyangiaceae bacterium]|nr:AraC family transcriptional regulator [Polyangiaceae bacterium]
HAFQRACARLARKTGDVVAGQVGDHGLVFLTGFAGSGGAARSKLADLATRTSALARRFGFRFHAGVSLGRPSHALRNASRGNTLGDTRDAALPVRYRAAILAAEHAASHGLSLAYEQPRSERSKQGLRKLRRRLTQGIEVQPHLLHARFEQYIQAVVAGAEHRLDVVKRELDAGLERLTEPLIAIGVLDEKSFDDMQELTERATTQGASVSALVASYRQLVAEIQGAIQRPTLARQERSTERAIAFIRDHLSEPLSLLQVSSVAGFAPSYFSKLFKRSEGVTLQSYILELRIARAAEMLRGSKLSIERTRQLSGFRTRGYFNRAFKQATGVSPIEFRRGGRRVRLAHRV